jgi:predicted phosphodiesterase
MRPLALLALLVIGVPAFAQDHVRFVVTGDDRWNTGSPREGKDENGVNVTDLTRLLKAMMADKPDAMLLSGDLIGGGKTDEAEASQFETWLKVMKPAYDAGIKVLTVRGNHEMHCPHADDIWKKAMSGEFANPTNGPAGEIDRTYAFPMKNCLFIALDEFEGPSIGVDQAWVDSVLKAKHPPHVFAFAHEMAFFSGNHVDGLQAEPAARDTLMKSLVGAGAKVIFFGHDHLYDDCIATLPDGTTIRQVVCGTAGAPFARTKPLTTTDHDWKINRVTHVDHRLGYVLVDVNGNHVKMTYMAETPSGGFENADSFEYSIGS